jgi:hypothetical protein
MKTLETKILDIYTRSSIYKQFWARDIAIAKVDRYLTCLAMSNAYIDNVLESIFGAVKELHEEERMRMGVNN